MPRPVAAVPLSGHRRWRRRADGQLELLTPGAPQLTARDTLRVLLEETGWSQYDFARLVLGCHERTLQRYLDGGRIPEDRGNWIRRLASIELDGDEVRLVIRASRMVAREKRHISAPRHNFTR